MADDFDTSSGVRKKLRSPAYPAAGLETALKWAKKIYDAERGSTTGQEIAVQHMGYSSLSGPSRTAMATLKRFGLLIDDGTGVRLTEDALKWSRTPDEAEKALLIQGFAKKPEIIKELLAQYSGDLPSDATLRYRLIQDRNFTEEAAKTFVRAFRETIQFAKLDTSSDTSPDEAVDITKENQIPERALAVIPRKPAAQTGAPDSARWELSDGTFVELRASGPLTPGLLDDVQEYLKSFRTVLEKREKNRLGSQGVAEEPTS